MKLLVCDVEGTLIKQHRLKDAQHSSYIWTSIAQSLGRAAEREELATQKKWHSGGYHGKDGEAYIDWIHDSIEIHIKHNLTESTFNRIIENAPYVKGVLRFFRFLDRTKYIPVLVSGGMHNLNEKLCRELGIDINDSYAACKYYFNAEGNIDRDLTFADTCDFQGKSELVRILLRKYGLAESDLVVIGDGANDVNIAKWANQMGAVSIGISPIDTMRGIAARSYDNFLDMMDDTEFMAEHAFLTHEPQPEPSQAEPLTAREYAHERLARQIGRLNLSGLESLAIARLESVVGHIEPYKRRRFEGIEKLLEHGELSLALISAEIGNAPIVSALLQPFTNAAESMFYVYLALTTEETFFKRLLGGNPSLREFREHIDNTDLRIVLREYFRNRNISAHTCQEIPIDAAQTFIRRTYEIIQRLELIIHDA